MVRPGNLNASACAGEASNCHPDLLLGTRDCRPRVIGPSEPRTTEGDRDPPLAATDHAASNAESHHCIGMERAPLVPLSWNRIEAVMCEPPSEFSGRAISRVQPFFGATQPS